MKTLTIKVEPEIDYDAAFRYARTMRDHYTALIAKLDELEGHQCGSGPGMCGDTDGRNLWHIAAYLPAGNEAEALHSMQHELGLPVYRSWPVDRANMAELAKSLGAEPDHECAQECCIAAITDRISGLDRDRGHGGFADGWNSAIDTILDLVGQSAGDAS